MDRILKILKKENGPRASSAPALELNTIIFKHVYWYMQQISGERLQDHWSSGYKFTIEHARMKQLNGKMHFKLPGLRVDVNKCHLNLNRILNVCTTSQFQYFILL